MNILFKKPKNELQIRLQADLKLCVSNELAYLICWSVTHDIQPNEREHYRNNYFFNYIFFISMNCTEI